MQVVLIHKLCFIDILIFTIQEIGYPLKSLVQAEIFL